MTRVALLSPSVNVADAVSNDVLGMYDTLVARGHDVRIFAGTWTVPRPNVSHFPAIRKYLSSAEDLVIYHHSIGWEDGLQTLQKLSCRKVVKYHNVTPPEFFDGISDDYQNVCRLGRQHLQALTQLPIERFLADSDFNRAEVIEAGVAADRCTVVFPFHRTDRLHALPAELAIVDAFRDGKVNLLSVGRLAPNKGHVLLITAFAIYHHDYNPNSRLLIVGKEDLLLTRYSGYLRGLTAGLGVEDAVVFAGEVSDAELKAYYLLADVFLALSDHEGFCIPLVEAMALKVPIVARAATAIPATLGDAGLSWTEKDPDLIAETVDTVVRDEEVRAVLGRSGWQRYRRLFDNQRIAEQFVAALDDIL